MTHIANAIPVYLTMHMWNSIGLDCVQSTLQQPLNNLNYTLIEVHDTLQAANQFLHALKDKTKCAT